MRQLNWFKRTTGSPIVLAFSDCECKAYGRDHCFGCVSAKEYEEREQPFQSQNQQPSWKTRWVKTNVLTTADMDFLLNRKRVFTPRRRREWRPVRKTY